MFSHSSDEIFILQKEIVGAVNSYLLKLNRKSSCLEVYKSCSKERIFDFLPIRKDYGQEDYIIYEKTRSISCLFGGENSPTPCGIFHIKSKTKDEYLSPFYSGYEKVKFFGYMMIFEDYFIHSDLYKTDQDTPQPEKSISRNDKYTSGCIRVSQKDLEWLMQTIEPKTLIIL